MKILRAWTFQWWEVSLLKICLLSLGIILGLYFSAYLVSFLWLWWVLFVVTTIYFIAKLFSEK
jgi:hypothetical protein